MGKVRFSHFMGNSMGHWMIRRATGVALLREDSPQKTVCLAYLVMMSCLQVLREILQESQA